MIQQGTWLTVADNTGAKIAKCIKVLGSSKKRYSKVGDIIVVVIKDANPKGLVRKKTIERAVILRQIKELSRKDGSSIKFDDNAVAIVDKEGVPKGTRIFGPVAKELRDLGFKKIISLASEVV